MWKKNQGFSLVELSVVVFIIGIIVASVSATINFLHNARMKSTVDKALSYVQAATTFHDAYNYYPGDIPYATALFGASGGASPVDINGYALNNGNGDGMVGDYSITGSEQLGAWQHMALAAMIPGTYTGNTVAASSRNNIVAGLNVPRVDLSSNAVFSFYAGNLWNNFNSSNYVVASGYTFYNSSDLPISVIDARTIDVKFDDGLPFVGKIISYDETPNCATVSMASSLSVPYSQYTYQNTNTGTCVLSFLVGDGLSR